jgi:indole-3-glycerol phosphate synthase
MTRPDILTRILEVKREEIQIAKQELSEAALIQEIVRARDQPSHAPRGFLRAIQSKHAQGLAAVISEIKRASPSKGLLRDPYLPAEIAKDYEQGGAACLSVLTDREFFKGDSGDLIAARAATGIPVLRKDFMIDPYQIFEARAMGADCILLIAACLDHAQMIDLEAQAHELGMAVLVEVHDAEELERVLALDGVDLIGINNRNLATFETDLATTEALTAEYGERIRAKGALLVSESGLFNRDVLDRVQQAGADAVLVGESLRRQEDVTTALETLIGG